MIVNFDLYRFTPTGNFELYEVSDPGPAVLLADIADARGQFQPLGAHMEGDLVIPLTPTNWGAIWGTALAIGLDLPPVNAIATIPDEEFEIIFAFTPIDARATFAPLIIEEPVLTAAVDVRPSWERPVSRATLLEALSQAGGS